MDFETEFFSELIKLQYGDYSDNLIKFSSKVKWAKGWPNKNESFWNAEAFMWKHKIEKEKRALITKELSFLEGKNNLDLGCGSYSYLKSTGADFSEKMLDFNENCIRKVQVDLEYKLPFENEEFASATAIFVLNYIQNYASLLSEIHRVIKKKGHFMMILSSKPINEWQRQKEVNFFDAEKWKQIIEQNGFSVEFYEKEGLWFFKCNKI